MFSTAVLAIILTARNSDAAGENAREFAALCGLYKMFAQPISKPLVSEDSTNAGGGQTVKQAVSAIVEDIYKLNLTVIGPEAKAVLADDATYKQWEKVVSDKKHGHFKISTQDELDVLKRLLKATQGQAAETFKKKFNLPLPEARRIALAPIFDHLTTRVVELAKKAENLDTAMNEQANQAAQAFAEALYGTELKKTAGEGNSNPTEVGSKLSATNFPFDNSDRDTVCKTASETKDKAGYSLVTDMVCLCSVKSTGTRGGVCSNPADGTITYIDDRTQKQLAHGNFLRLMATCSKLVPKAPPLTPERIHSALAEFLGLLGTNFRGVTGNAATSGHDPANRGILGVYDLHTTNKGQCASDYTEGTAAQNKGVCISYTEQLAKPTGIPWMAAARTGAMHLKKLKRLFTQATPFIAQSVSIQHQMESLLLMGHLLTPAPTRGPEAASNQPSVEEQNKCKAATNKTVEGCEAIGCGYDENKKECKPKTGTENTVETGTGDGAPGAAASAGCATHKDKTTCENDKKGDKQNCAWRKGKDGETDEPEKEKCRNGSFLVTKKLAMNSASFVSFVAI
uniref:Variant surface glycoprotein 675 n=1 Tax=Trypanosoma brucei TaxID=5691 RepID=M4SYW5_9TRYP|nr:variant surface glycoprotein 675 [Trypanosoma brucei]